MPRGALALPFVFASAFRGMFSLSFLRNRIGIRDVAACTHGTRVRNCKTSRIT